MPIICHTNYNLSNKPDGVIYVDLANCFRTTNLGTSHCYYSNDIITENISNTNGGSFNLCGITNAAGIGGAIGGLANATTLGKSQTSSISKTHIKQRILQIPPKGRVYLTSFEYIKTKRGNVMKFGTFELSSKGEEFYFANPTK